MRCWPPPTCPGPARLPGPARRKSRPLPRFPTSLRPPAGPPRAVPGCGRPRAVAASRTMSPGRASPGGGGDCTTLGSQAGRGEGTAAGRHVLGSRPPPAPAPPRTGVALPYLRPLTPAGEWTCPSAVCHLPGSCGKMDPPARRRVGSCCLTRPLLGVRLGPGRQENQHLERPASARPARREPSPPEPRGPASPRGDRPGPGGQRLLPRPTPGRALARPSAHGGPALRPRPPSSPGPRRVLPTRVSPPPWWAGAERCPRRGAAARGAPASCKCFLTGNPGSQT